MPDDELFLCSELVRISAGRGSKIGNLEVIGPQGCTVTVDCPIPAGSEVRMHCVECPLGKKSCTECRFRGRIKSSEDDPVLGCLLQVEFEGRCWSPKEWHPRHLTDVRKLKEAPASPVPPKS
jgi:hypothetical protein